MKIIKTYRLFEQEERRKDVIDGIMYFLPSLARDPFTVSLLPLIRSLMGSNDPAVISRSLESITSLSKKKFSGFDTRITMQEVMERFVNHYIDPDNGLLKKREVKRLIKDVKPPVKRSVKADLSYRVTPDSLDNFTDSLLAFLKKQGIKEQDIKKQLKEIYTWFGFVLEHFYHLDSIRGMKYMQVGVLFDEQELNSYLGLTEDQSNSSL